MVDHKDKDFVSDFKKFLSKEDTSWSLKIVTLFEIFITIIAVLFVILIVVYRTQYSSNKANICLSADCVDSSEFFRDIIDNSIDPCEDFYEFACGGYEGPTSTLQEAQARVLGEFVSLITGPAKGEDEPSVRKQKKYFQACMDTARIEQDDSRSARELYGKLGGWPALSYEWVNKFCLGCMVEKCADLGLSYDWFIEVDVEVDGDGYPTLRLSAPVRSVNIVESQFKDNYQLLVENVIKRIRANNSLDNISIAAKSVVDFEESLAKIVSKSGENYTQTTIDDLQTMFPNLPLNAFIKNVEMDKNATIEANVAYIAKLLRFLEKSSSRTTVNYIMWKITENLSKFLPTNIRREFDIYNEDTANRTNPKRETFCYRTTEVLFAYVSEAAYARKYASARPTIQTIFDNIKLVTKDHIDAAKWMDDAHKTRAVEKLQNVSLTIGGPEEVFDAPSFDRSIGVDKVDILDIGNVLDIVRATDRSRDKYNLDLKRRRIVDADGRLYADIVDIHAMRYIPEDNVIYFPAAFIGGVFDSHKGLHFRNYSVLGIVLAHELSHAFGILDAYDPIEHVLLNNWSNSTYQAFLNATDCLMEQCFDFNDTTQVQHTNNSRCIRTFDENFADYASVDVAFEAFKKIKAEEINQLPGLKYKLDELFWISYAATMCDSMNTTAQSKTNPFIKTHLEPSKRILGSYRNSKYFSETFNCTEDSYMNPADKCVVL
ncbi:unnamed protein product [Phyllotreta striolata]|uniref:Uncharacterized protein n=1 Tax=Phyllotreta striolata TaxID=444603 RepID=A0A9P0DW27_PHYSR|nr:unnamed protein product [Phyllotreta striolata]